MGGQLISIRLPKMGISAEICAGVGRTRNCLGVLLVTEPPEYGLFGIKTEAVYSVCAPEDEWNFWTGFEVAASRLRHPHISYPLLIEALRPLVEASLRTKNPATITFVPSQPSPSIIPPELKTTVIDSPKMFNMPQISEWNGGAYCTSMWKDGCDLIVENGAWGRTRKEAFGRWLSGAHKMPEYVSRHWKGYYAAFPEDAKSSRRSPRNA